MLTLEHINQFLEWAQRAPLFYFSVALTAICSSAFVSSIGSRMVRGTFYLFLACSAYYTAITQHDIPYDFMLNMSTELVGALLVGVLLSDFFKDMLSLWAIFAGVAVGSTLLIDGTESLLQSSYINLSTEFLGALIVAMLLKRRHWFWNAAREERLRIEKEERELALEKDQQLRSQIYEKIASDLDEELEKWQSKQDSWDVAIIISAEDEQKLKLKRRLLARKLHKINTLRQVVDDAGATCYVAGKLRCPK